DHLATGADDLPDLVLVHRDGDDARRVHGDVGAVGGQGRVHHVQDVEASEARLLQCLAHDLPGDPGDLDVHLQGGDALAGPRHLEVHVAVVVLGAGDVGEHGEALPLLDQAHGHAGHG